MWISSFGFAAQFSTATGASSWWEIHSDEGTKQAPVFLKITPKFGGEPRQCTPKIFGQEKYLKEDEGNGKGWGWRKWWKLAKWWKKWLNDEINDEDEEKYDENEENVNTGEENDEIYGEDENYGKK